MATRSRTASTAVTSKRMTVTSKQAEQWLGHNSHNRPLRNNTVANLAAAIMRGEWKFNGDAIRFAKDGTLLDGQHRLWAIVEAERISEQPQTIDTLVIEGLELDAQETMDVGARRNLKDTLVLRGETNGTKLAALIAYWWRYQEGQVRYASAKPTIAQGVATLDAHPGLRQIIPTSERLRHRFRVSSAMVGACLYEFQTIEADDVTDFVNLLVDGAGLEEGSPILALRRWLERQTVNAVGARASALTTHALLIKAWNYWRDGQHVDKLSWKASGLKAEPFPEPH